MAEEQGRYRPVRRPHPTTPATPVGRADQLAGPHSAQSGGRASPRAARPAGDPRVPAGHGDEEAAPEGEHAADEEAAPEHPKPPWHFKLMLWGTAIYLTYRLYQGVTWVVHHV